MPNKIIWDEQPQINPKNIQWDEVPSAKPNAPRQYTGGEALAEGFSNLIPSTFNYAVDTASALLHPVDTATNVVRLAEGGLANLSEAIPGKATSVKNRYTQAMQPSKSDLKRMAQNKTMASAVGKQYADRYGSWEGFKRAVAEDPASVLGDISTVLTGGAALAPKAGKTAAVLRTMGDVTNPLYAVEKTAKIATAPIVGAKFNVPVVNKELNVPSAAKGFIGTATGTGEAINQAIKAGESGSEVFLNNLRKQADMQDVVKTASQGLNAMKAEKNAAYRSGMVDIKNDKSILSFDDIDEAIKSAQSKGSYEGIPTNEKTLKSVQEAKTAVNEWKNGDPSKFHTPEGLDALKQRIGSIIEDLPYDSQARVAINDIYHATKKTIQDQAPTYADVMENYSKASDEINNIKSALSLNKKSNADTALKKLQSILRDDVSSSYGHRKQMAEKLIEHGAKDLMPALAGQALSSWKPRGMLGNLETAGGAYYLLTHPAALGTALMTAPFVVPRTAGEMAYAYGKGKGALKRAGEKVPFTKEQARRAAMLLQQTNQGEQ